MRPARLHLVDDIVRRRGRLREIIVFDPRRYGHYRSSLLVAERLYCWGLWTPFVRVRARRARGADGGTEA
ncbi:MAG TPA: hypothetical protein VHE57_07705 [Mycobacteriales bacterium]|nr:hypothetical protein [Mycobacteriales bacterium]